MEGSLSTADFLALENRGYGYCHHKDHSGQRATGIGLAAGLGGGALLLAIAGLWGLNKASEARNHGALAGIASLTAALGSVNNNVNANRQAIELALANERSSREKWQSDQMPSVQSYIDVQASPAAQSSASAAAEAAAFAQLYNNGGINSAIGTDSFLKVQRYSAPVPCGCDTCNG